MPFSMIVVPLIVCTLSFAVGLKLMEVSKVFGTALALASVILLAVNAIGRQWVWKKLQTEREQ